MNTSRSSRIVRTLGLGSLAVAMLGAAAVAFGGCGSSDGEVSAGIGEDASTGARDDGGDGGGQLGDAQGGDAAGGSACEGACKTTTLEVEIAGKRAPMARAQFGTEVLDGEPVFYLESHYGGSPNCPEEDSPSPDRTLIVANVPQGRASASYDDGVRSSLLDFKRELLDGVLPAKATAITITNLLQDTESPPRWVAFDLDETLENGSAKGHVYATFCQSMSR